MSRLQARGERKPQGGLKWLIIALITLAVSAGFMVIAIELACRYLDAYHDWRYEPMPPAVARPSDAEIAHVSAVGGTWLMCAVCAAPVVLISLVWCAACLIRWLSRRGPRSRGFEVLVSDRNERGAIR